MNFVETLSSTGRALKLKLVYPKNARQIINIFNNNIIYTPTIDYSQVESISIKVDIKINNMVPATLEMDLSVLVDFPKLKKLVFLKIAAFKNFNYRYKAIIPPLNIEYLVVNHAHFEITNEKYPSLDTVELNRFDYRYDVMDFVGINLNHCIFNNCLLDKNISRNNIFTRYNGCHINNFDFRHFYYGDISNDTTVDRFNNRPGSFCKLYQYVKGKTRILQYESCFYFMDNKLPPTSKLESEVMLIIAADFKIDCLPPNISELKINNGCSIDIGDNSIKVLNINTNEDIHINFDQLYKLKIINITGSHPLGIIDNLVFIHKLYMANYKIDITIKNYEVNIPEHWEEKIARKIYYQTNLKFSVNLTNLSSERINKGKPAYNPLGKKSAIMNHH